MITEGQNLVMDSFLFFIACAFLHMLLNTASAPVQFMNLCTMSYLPFCFQ